MSRKPHPAFEERPIFTTVLARWGSREFGNYPDHDELVDIVLQMLERQGLEAVRTNATKHGDTQIVLRTTEP